MRTHTVPASAERAWCQAPLLRAVDSSARKLFRHGTHRVAAPEETTGRVGPLLPVLGITRTAVVTGLDCIGIPVVMVCRPNARSLSVSQGKGLTLALATASGLMESIELYHAERVTLPLRLASYNELRYAHRVIDVTGLARVLDSVFHPDLSMLWVEGHDVLGDETVWVPYEVVHTNYALPLAPGSGCFSSTSSGLASGNHLLEAVSHGICEVVERDAATLWRLMNSDFQRATSLDLDTVDDPACRTVLERYDRARVAVAVWETTTEVGIPSFVCSIVDRLEDPTRLIDAAEGSGCHPAREVALLRALTEAAQSRLTLIAGSRDDHPRRDYERFFNVDTVRHHRALLDAKKGQARSFQSVATWESETLQDDVVWELERVRSAGIQRVVVVNLTRPEFNLPVVRVVIPGLEGYDKAPRYLHGQRAQARTRLSP
jgi:YcaO-like protein with predicted kinase domain